MAPIALAYDGDENGDQNRLNEWLMFDAWGRYDAALIFADINPESVEHDFESATTFRGATILNRDIQGDLIRYWVESDGTNVYEGSDELAYLHRYCADLHRTLVTKDHASPKEWIDIAISKKIDIPWLEWAKKRGLVEHIDAPGVPTPEPKPAPAPAPNSSDWKEQARAIADELYDQDTDATELGCRDSLAGYSDRVMVIMQDRGIEGGQGRITSHRTIMRDALQGGKWWRTSDKGTRAKQEDAGGKPGKPGEHEK